jgi:hypothetical protein
MLRLQQQQLAALNVDRVYDDRLSDAISHELWTEKSGELQEQLRRVRAGMERHDRASQAYETAGLQTLELARSAYTSAIRKDRTNKRPMKTVVSNSTFGRESLSPTSIKPFDECANGAKVESGSSGWIRTSNPPVNSVTQVAGLAGSSCR